VSAPRTSLPGAPAPLPPETIVDRSTSSRAATTRRVGRALSLAAALLVAAATLTPVPVGPEDATLGPWCLVCGRLGGADVVSNVLLFLPLGLGLGLAGAGWRRAGVIALLGSVGIELAQHFAIPGRFGTLSDVLANATGGILGALAARTRHVWLRPGARAAAVLATASALGWLGILAFSAWALRRDPTPGPWPPAVPTHPFATGYGWFDGRVERASIDGMPVGHRGTGPVVVSAATGRDVALAARVRGGEDSDEYVPMLFLTGRTGGMEAMIGQRDRDLVFRVHLRAAALRLRSPQATLRGEYAYRSDDTATVQRVWARASRDSLVVGVERDDGRTRSQVVHLTPTRGWSLLLPFVRADGPEQNVVSTLWIAALLLPSGYWLAAWGAAARRAEAAAVAGLVAIVAGLAGVPIVADAPRAHWWEWAAAAVGAAAGALGTVVVSTSLRRGRAADRERRSG
jgi:hypothetical protein